MFTNLLQRFTGRFRSPGTLRTAGDVLEVLGELFRAHAVPCAVESNRLRAQGLGFSVQAELFTLASRAGTFVVQLDLSFRMPGGERVLESCSGFGQTLHDAIGDGIKNFCDSSFHVIVSTVTGGSCTHCEVVEWEIGGLPRRVYLGPLTTGGSLGSRAYVPALWFDEVTPLVQALTLPPGLHWLRLYHGECPNSEPTSEALLDNQTEPGLQQQIAAYLWPEPETFYSARVFMIITDRPANGH